MTKDETPAGRSSVPAPSSSAPRPPSVPGPRCVKVEVLSWIARDLKGQRSDKAVWEEEIAQDETLGDLMDRLAGRFPSFADFYDPSTRTLQEHVELVLNGRLYDLVGGFEARLESGDTVMMFPGYSGG
jgi:molybdopterin converting factor small subunit